MLVNGKKNLNLTPIEIYKLKDNHEDGESDKHNGLLTLLLPMKWNSQVRKFWKNVG